MSETIGQGFDIKGFMDSHHDFTMASSRIMAMPPPLKGVTLQMFMDLARSDPTEEQVLDYVKEKVKAYYFDNGYDTMPAQEAEATMRFMLTACHNHMMLAVADYQRAVKAARAKETQAKHGKQVTRERSLTLDDAIMAVQDVPELEKVVLTKRPYGWLTTNIYSTRKA